MDISFQNKVVVITGGAGGFGSATARSFAAAGASVVISDINLEAAQALAAELPSATAVQADVTDAASIKNLIEEAVSTYGGIDILVNNAGAPARFSELVDMDEDAIDWVTDINLRSTFLASKYAIPHLEKREGAAIVNVASIAASRPRPGSSIYCASKAGVQVFTKALAAELAPRIRVNAINPAVAETGFIMNHFGAELTDELRAKMLETIPLGRAAQPQDIANGILFLASDKADFMTGHNLDVDGGRSI